MKQITDFLKETREYKQILECIKEQRISPRPLPITVTGLCEDARSAFCRAISEDIREKGDLPLLIIAPDEKTANRLDRYLCLEAQGAVYAYRDMMFHNVVSSREYEFERLYVLCGILDGSFDYVITTPDALMQYTVPAKKLAESRRFIKSGDECSEEELTRLLCLCGYTQVEMVEGKGQFSRRGCIMDVFTPDSTAPVRIEFFGDEVDTISFFDPMTQRRGDMCDSIGISPCREVLIDDASKEAVCQVINKQLKATKSADKKEVFAQELEVLRSGTEAYFIDKYIAALYPECECLLDYFGKNFPYVMIEENSCVKRIESYEFHLRHQITELLGQGVDKDVCSYGKYKEDFDVAIQKNPGIIVNNFLSSSIYNRKAGLFTFVSKTTVSYADKFDLLIEDLYSYLRNDYRVIVLCENRSSVEQVVKVLDENHISALRESDPVFGKPLVIAHPSPLCFELTASRFVLLSTARSAEKVRASNLKKAKKKKHKSAGEAIMSYADMEIGDYVVHENHGIGQYLGLQSLTFDGVRRDFVKIKYDGKDALYLPCDQLDSISKYIGSKAEDGSVRLSKMGGNEWIKAKTKAKKAASDMAKELIQLYAARLRKEGFAFGRDDDLQEQFEEEFPYDETDGQLIATEEIKKDMESSHPMDRLLCGDVGFGKTEVALRAAFKAVNNSKQVAILVPTTILAMQHYQTIMYRMMGFPVKVDVLSRFRTPKQQQETLRRLRRGEIDIIVGTHRMISKDVVFKDLGLVIVDEEQRFGVAQKEKLKQMTENVDVLTLTATPIPRTLNMAMSGIRDMSVLEEAPEDRLPVQTYVLEYDDDIISEAINKELRRGGQVFYLYNRVETINNVAARIAAMAPEANIAVAHGQMDREEISDIWEKMTTGEIDILISTTIIETGIDIPNANTLIIENSDRMGLSQLHQIRGRIGRSTRRAYAYFTYPRGKVLTEISEKRLGAIRDYTEFGSGFKIALRDLEIRGAGNILGSEQHGNIESVGYDLYIKILNRAILEEKGELPKPKAECNVDIKMNAYLPESYITSAAGRIEAYKKIASIENYDDLSDIIDELLDRYGEMPVQCDNLCHISLLRALGSECFMEKIVSQGKSILFYPLNMDAQCWTYLAAKHKGKILLNLSSKPYATFRLQGESRPLDKCCELLSDYLEFQKEKSRQQENDKEQKNEAK